MDVWARNVFGFVFLVYFVVRCSYYEFMLIVQSQSMDVYRNLALEEYLMEHVEDMGPVLFLWQSECAVVMGKNQNPWKECRLDLMRGEGVPLARRISGGGTVYHDAGNLNYCVIVDRREYREQQAYDLVLRALGRFGIKAEKTGKSNLSLDGLKFSGNAFCFRKGRALHHGTLLLDTDLERLNRYLGSMFNGIDTHAIASVPAPVTNLGVDRAALSTGLAECFIDLYDNGAVARWTDGDVNGEALESLRHRQASDEWRYGATPRFSIGLPDLRLEVVKGLVVQAEGDRASCGFIEKHFSDIAFSLVC